jgi:hypothetical protein
MANWVKYGTYYISGAIAVGGILWWSRPGDKMIRGEDYANIFEAVQERAVIPYLTGDALPDWAAANDSSTNSIDSRIQYADILTMANRIRAIVTKTDSTIFWTNEAITNRSSLAVSRGSYAMTNEIGFLIDQTGTPTYTTNNIYSYTTNVVLDTIATTASRIWKTNSLFEYQIKSGVGYSAMSLTNLPLGNLVFEKGESKSLVSQSLPGGAWWPFPRAYSFPWEQFSSPIRSRISVRQLSGLNISFTNVSWITPSSLEARCYPIFATNTDDWYSVSVFEDVNGNRSVPFMVFTTKRPAWPNPPATPPIIAMSEDSIEQEFPLGVNFTPNVSYVLKNAAVSNAYIRATVVYGTDNFPTPVRSVDYFNYSGFLFTNLYSEAWGLVKYEAYADSAASLPITNCAPAYSYVRFSNNEWSGTNDYFSISAPAYFSGFTAYISAQATTNAITSQQVAKDDKRLLMSKLYDFRTSMTNLTRTVWIGGAGSITATNAVETITDITPENCWPSTNVWYVSRSGVGDFTPTYDTGYDLSALRSAFLGGYDRVRTNSASTTLSLLSKLNFGFDANGVSEVYSSGNWDSNTQVQLIDNSKSKWSYYGVTPAYPSLYAVTNGYVKKVKVFAVVEMQNVAPNNAYPASAGYYSHSVAGNYIYSGNMGVSHGTLAISGAPDTIDTTIRKYNYADFKSASGGNSFVNESVLNLIYEVNNPTNKIMFDFEPAEFTHSLCDTYRYHFQQSAASSAARTEDWSYDYSQYYEIAVTRWVVVVDWKFQNYGGYLFDIENQSVTVRSIDASGSNVVIVVTSAQVPLMPPVLQWKTALDSGSWNNVAATVTQVAVPAGVTNAARAYQFTVPKSSSVTTNGWVEAELFEGVWYGGFWDTTQQGFYRVRDNSAEY